MKLRLDVPQSPPNITFTFQDGTDAQIRFDNETLQFFVNGIRIIGLYEDGRIVLHSPDDGQTIEGVFAPPGHVGQTLLKFFSLINGNFEDGIVKAIAQWLRTDMQQVEPKSLDELARLIERRAYY